MTTISIARGLAALALPALLVACGGDDDTATTVTPSSLSVSGTAATGAAISGGSVTAKCAAGTSSAVTTATNGTYTLSVTDGTLPCVLQVTSADGSTTLFSVAMGSGSSATANITPLTQLVVASLVGDDPATWFKSFDSSAASTVTSSALSTAQSAVVSTLAAAGIDLSGVGDLVTGTLTAASSGGSGNAYDAALEALNTTLAATLDSSGEPMTLAALTSAVAAASTTTTTPPPASGTVSLPPDLLLKPAASTCSALRSATYRAVEPAPGETLADRTELVTFDATTLTLTYSDGQTDTWVPHATEACRFTDATGHADFVVSQAGVIVARAYDTATGEYNAAIAFPEQAHTLADLAGTWNTLGLQYDDSAGTYFGSSAYGTISSSGVISAVFDCDQSQDWNVSACAADTDAPSTVSVDANGGFDFTDAGASTATGRTFVYRAGSGDLMMVHVDADGSFAVRTMQHANAMPAVGRVSTSWDVRYTNLWQATLAVTGSTNTVESVDATAGSYVRLAKTVGGTDDHLETILLNDPRDGFNFRAGVATTGIDGTTPITVTEWTNMSVRGMGFNVLARPTQKQLMLSVQQP